MKIKTKFPAPKGAHFYAELRQRVNADFLAQDLSVNANSLMWLKTFIFLSLFIIIYLTIILSGFNGIILTLLTLSLGVVCAFIGFNICHDAIHGSFSANKQTGFFITNDETDIPGL